MLKILLETIVKCLFYSTVGSKIQLLLHYIIFKENFCAYVSNHVFYFLTLDSSITMTVLKYNSIFKQWW